MKVALMSRIEDTRIGRIHGKMIDLANDRSPQDGLRLHLPVLALAHDHFLGRVPLQDAAVVQHETTWLLIGMVRGKYLSLKRIAN